MGKQKRDFFLKDIKYPKKVNKWKIYKKPTTGAHIWIYNNDIYTHAIAYTQKVPSGNIHSASISIPKRGQTINKELKTRQASVNFVVKYMKEHTGER